MKKKFNRNDWLNVPFETVEGIVEVWLYDECWGSNIHILTRVGDDGRLEKWMKRVMGIEHIAGEKMADTMNRLAGTCLDVHHPTDPCKQAQVIGFRGRYEATTSNMLTICHELHHATTNILHSKGLKLSDQTEEAWAYLHESLLCRAIGALGKKVIRYKK